VGNLRPDLTFVLNSAGIGLAPASQRSPACGRSVSIGKSLAFPRGMAVKPSSCCGVRVPAAACLSMPPTDACGCPSASGRPSTSGSTPLPRRSSSHDGPRGLRVRGRDEPSRRGRPRPLVPLRCRSRALDSYQGGLLPHRLAISGPARIGSDSLALSHGALRPRASGSPAGCSDLEICSFRSRSSVARLIVGAVPFDLLGWTHHQREDKQAPPDIQGRRRSPLRARSSARPPGGGWRVAIRRMRSTFNRGGANALAQGAGIALRARAPLLW